MTNTEIPLGKGLSGGEGKAEIKEKKKSLGEACSYISEQKAFILFRKFSSDF